MLFPFWLKFRRDEAIQSVRDEIKRSTVSRDKADHEVRKALIMSQATWPYEDKVFSRLVGLTLLLVVFPFFLTFAAVPAQFQQAFNGATICKNLMRNIAHWTHELPSNGNSSP